MADGFLREKRSRRAPAHCQAGSGLLESTWNYTLNYQLAIPANYVWGRTRRTS